MIALGGATPKVAFLRRAVWFLQAPLDAIRERADTIEVIFDSSYDIQFTEGADVGYRWFVKTGEKPLVPLGHGLSYTSFAVSDLQVQGGKKFTVSFAIKSAGSRAGANVPQVYLRSAAGRPLEWLVD